MATTGVGFRGSGLGSWDSTEHVGAGGMGTVVQAAANECTERHPLDQVRRWACTRAFCKQRLAGWNVSLHSEMVGSGVGKALLGLCTRFSHKCWLRMDGKEVRAGLKTLLESHQAEKGTNQSISTMRSSSSCNGHQAAPSIRKARS